MKNHKIKFSQLHFLILILLVLSLFFRFVNLGGKVYWLDETATSVRISGYTWTDMDREFGGLTVYKPVKEIGIEDLQKYQRLNSHKSLIDTVKGLALEEPQQPPLYFSLVRFWAQWFGDSVAAIRSLSALISLLVFPVTYWLCLELFKSPLVGWIAVSLMAVSPFQLLYAQEARPYILWAVMTLLSTTLLVQAMRLKTKVSWGFYAATVSLGFYSHLFFGCVGVGHAISVITSEGWRLTKTVRDYLVASILGIIVFLPWFVFTINGFSKVLSTTSWGTQKPWAFLGINSRLTLLLKSARNLSANFIDADKDQKIINLGFDNLFAYSIQALVVLIMVGLISYSIYFVWRSNRKSALVILPLIAVPALALMIPDLILGSYRSVSRYITPSFLGVQLSVAYLLASQMTSISNSIWRQQLGRFVFAVLISCGIFSCTVISQTPGWWTKTGSYDDFQMAQMINQIPHPLVIFGGWGASTHALSLSHLLKPDVRLELVMEPNMPQFFDGFSNRLLLRPTAEIIAHLQNEQNSKFTPLYTSTKKWIGQVESEVLLWRIE